MELEKHLKELKSELTNREEQKEQAHKNLLELKGKPEYNIAFGKYDALCSICEDLKVDIFLTEKLIIEDENK